MSNTKFKIEFEYKSDRTYAHSDDSVLNVDNVDRDISHAMINFKHDHNVSFVTLAENTEAEFAFAQNTLYIVYEEKFFQYEINSLKDLDALYQEYESFDDINLMNAISCLTSIYDHNVLSNCANEFSKKQKAKAEVLQMQLEKLLDHADKTAFNLCVMSNIKTNNIDLHNEETFINIIRFAMIDLDSETQIQNSFYTYKKRVLDMIKTRENM